MQSIVSIVSVYIVLLLAVACLHFYMKTTAKCILHESYYSVSPKPSSPSLKPTPAKPTPAKPTPAKPTPAMIISPSPSPSPSQQPQLSQFASSILDVTNARRAHHSAKPLTWDNDLANAALDVGKKCSSDHSSLPYGENIAFGGSIYDNPAQLADNWYKREACKYDYNNPYYSNSTGHFTQEVWTSTQRMGCAFVTDTECPKGIALPGTTRRAQSMLICEYSPQGNLEYSSFEKDVLPPITPLVCDENNNVV